jgi:hypothetical protein
MASDIDDAINTMDANTAVMIVSTATLNGTPLIMSTTTPSTSGMTKTTLRLGKRRFIHPQFPGSNYGKKR